MKIKLDAALMIFFLTVPALHANEVLEQNQTQTQVVVREHPHTGKPFVTIVPAGQDLNKDKFSRYRRAGSRPDYRLLDPNMKAGDIPYDGPVSSRKKVYILAASLATIGVAGGTSIIAAAPAATGAGAAAGAGGYAAAGGAVAAGTLSASLFASNPGPDDRNFTHVSESHAVKEGTENPYW